MNQRIKELAVEAKLNSDAVPYHLDDYFSLGPYEAVDKFAELIVRECADIAYEYDAPKMSGPGMIIAGRIESHFGVEE